MSNIGGKLLNRALATVLAVAIVFSLMPWSVSFRAATTEYPDAFTVTVTDGKGVVEGASVKVFNESDELFIEADPSDPESQDKDLRFSYEALVTNENGVVSVPEITALFTELAALGIDSLDVNYEVSKTDYVTAEGSVSVSAEKATEFNVEVELTSALIDDVTVNGLSYVYDGTEKELVSVTSAIGDTVTYSVDGGAQTSEVPVATDVCSHEIVVTVSREGKKDLVKTVTGKITAADITDISIAGKEISYDESEHMIAVLNGSFKDGDVVTWTVNGEETVSTDIPERIAVGSYSVTVTVERANYNKFVSDTVVTKIVPGDLAIDSLEVNGLEGVYSVENGVPVAQPAVSVKNQGNYDLKYQLDDGDAVVDEGAWVNEIPTVTDAGSYIVWVKAVKDGYNDSAVEVLPAESAVTPYNVFIAKADQSLVFDKYEAMADASSPEKTVLKGVVPNGKEFDFSAKDKTEYASNKIAYAIETSEEEIASIDANTGLLTVNYPGEITVIATLHGNENLNECVIRYYLDVTAEVESDSQYIYFENTEITYILGTSDIISEQEAQKKNQRIKGNITYSMSSYEGIDFDTETGKVTVSDYEKLAETLRDANGEIELVVNAEKASSGRFGKDKASYKIVLKFETVPSKAYTLSEIDGTNGWYKSDVTVTPAQGYSISQGITAEFGSSTVFKDQGMNARYVYLKNNTTGGLTDKIAVLDANGYELLIDTVKPGTADMKIEFSDPVWPEKLANLLTLGYYNPSVTVKFTAQDETSGIDHFNWTYTKTTDSSDTNLADIEDKYIEVSVEDGIATAVLTLPLSEAQQMNGKISFYATDIAGNKSDYKADDYIFIVDTISPEMSVKYKGGEPYKNENGSVDNSHYFNSDIEVELSVKEVNFHSEDVTVQVQKDGASFEDVAPVWTAAGSDKNIGTFTLEGDGDYIVKVTYTDRSGNKMTDYMSEILVVDNTDPVVEVAYNRAGDIQEIIFTVIEHNFRASDITVADSSSFKDINEKPISMTAAKLTEILRTAEWVQDEENKDKYTFVYRDLPNGIYDIKVDYTDIAGRTSITGEVAFTVDHDSPVNVSIEYITDPLDVFVSTVTFGFYNPSVELKFTAYDESSGVKNFTWSYAKFAGASEIDHVSEIAESAETTLTAIQDGTDKSKYTATVTLTAEQYNQLKGNISVKATDNFDNVSDKVSDSGYVVVVDTVAPTVNVSYTPYDNYVEATETYYYNNDVEVTVTVNEANFFADDVVVKVSKDGAEAAAVTPEWVDKSVDVHVGTFTLLGDGDYIITIEYQDKSNNTMIPYTSKVHTIDTIKPVIEFEFDRELQQTVFTVTDDNFFTDGISVLKDSSVVDGVTVEGGIKDITLKDLAFRVEDLTEVLQKANWERDGDTYTFVYDYCPDGVYANGIYDLKIVVKDLSTNEIELEPETFIIDHEIPTAVEIVYSQPVTSTVLEVVTLGFYNPDVTVTFVAHDYASGVDKFEWHYTKDVDASDINKESDASNTVFEATQDTADLSKFTASVTLPKEEAEQLRGYFSVIATDKYGNVADEVNDKENIIIVDTIAPEMSVSYPDPITTIDTTHYYNDEITLTFTVTEANFFAEDVKVSVSMDGEAAEAVTPEWDDEEDDVHVGTYTLTEDGDYKVYVEYKDRSNNSMASYESEIFTIDTTAPVLEFYFDQKAQTTTFTVIEHNFRASDITISGSVSDITGAPVEYDAEDITDILRNAQWTKTEDTYTYTYDYNSGNLFVSGIYDLTISYTDISKNSSSMEADTFIIDHDSPVDVRIEYSQSLAESVLEALTLGFYNPNVTITFVAHDYASGVNSFAYEYIRTTDASTINKASDGKATTLTAVQDSSDHSRYTASVTLPEDAAAQLKGYISVVATDNYNNSSTEYADSNHVVVVDTVSPTVSVEYSSPDRVVNNASYYKDNIEVTFTVTEANFFAEDVRVSLSKDGGVPVALDLSWSNSGGDVYIGKYTLTGDGDYIVSVDYTDRSKNEMVQYTSDTLTIDTVLPVISIDYQNKDVKNTLTDRNGNSRKYYDKTQTAVVKVTEHNFDPNEVEFIVTATDVSGNGLNVNSLYTKDSVWTNSGDVHTLVLTFPGDANYSLDVAYTDLATNMASDYTVDYFTVDKTAPTNVNVEYSTGMLETVLESVTFGFYNAKMTVKISASDDISGVNNFVYSYLNANGVSSVNAQLMDQLVSEANITYSADGKSSAISFDIPKMVLDNDNQFNGTVSFTVADRSGNKTSQREDKRIVVDNIAPKAQVSFNEPVNVEGDVSYYDGNIDVNVTINEANFYASDVIVLVSKDNGEAVPVTPTWTDSSVDVHIGRFTLTEDGDYRITINYTDKSTNKMTEYVSDQLTIDSVIEAPTYTVNGEAKVQIGGAYKNEAVIAFEFADINYNLNTVKLTKTRFDTVEDVTAQFVTVMDSEQGGSGSFSVPETVENDGIYVLTVSMSDKAGHQIESQLKFTINRFGSVYEYNENLVNLIRDGGSYVNSVNDELVITEYNADQLLSGSMNVLITRDGQVVDSEYSTTPEVVDSDVGVGNSGWYEYVYKISSANFAEDGVYKITITSQYKTDDMDYNDSTSVPENSMGENGEKILDTMSFTVDDTAPEIRNIVNLEESIVNAQALDVKFTIVDVGGIKEIDIILNGESVDTITEFNDGPFNYSGQFTINESTEAQTVQLVVTDLAGNVTDTASENFDSGELYVFNDSVTVSTNIFVRWYANKTLFWGSIAGVIAVAAIGLGIAVKGKKKN